MHKKNGLIVLLLLLNLFLMACGASPTVPANPPTPQPTSTLTVASSPTNPPPTATSVPFTPTAAPTATLRAVTTVPPSAAPTAPASGTPVALRPSGQFAEGKCFNQLPDGKLEGKDVICGFLTVPEDHSKAQGKTLKLAIATLKSARPNNNPPLVYLAGGPGGGAIDGIEGFTSSVFPDRRLADARDIIFIDQRGTGFSQPNLKCGEASDIQRKYLSQPYTKQAEQEIIASYGACRDRLLKEGVNLAVYNSAQNAADIEAMRLALKLDKIDLYGVSYGSRLALTIMRDFPQGIRSVIITSILPLQADVASEQGISFNNALEEFFKTCEADATCNRKTPDLRDTFDKAYTQLKTKPVTIPVTNLADNSKLDLYVDGEVFLTAVYYALFAGVLFLPQLPNLITATARGVYDPLGFVFGGLILPTIDSVSYGMYHSTQCAEEYSFSSPAKSRASYQNLLLPIKETGVDDFDSSFAICQLWNVPKSPPIENQPVKSDIPTFIINGKFDPITPPVYGQEAAKTLSKSTVVTLPNTGHDPATLNECATTMRLQFLADPTKPVDTQCVSRQRINF
jgi:pimeloyl-ACP methyl ester carboxylesterase